MYILYIDTHTHYTQIHTYIHTHTHTYTDIALQPSGRTVPTSSRQAHDSRRLGIHTHTCTHIHTHTHTNYT